jgi:hypothetical protein
MVVGLCGHELCDGFSVVEGYILLGNIQEPTQLEIICL